MWELTHLGLGSSHLASLWSPATLEKQMEIKVRTWCDVFNKSISCWSLIREVWGMMMLWHESTCYKRSTGICFVIKHNVDWWLSCFFLWVRKHSLRVNFVIWTIFICKRTFFLLKLFLHKNWKVNSVQSGLKMIFH